MRLPMSFGHDEKALPHGLAMLVLRRAEAAYSLAVSCLAEASVHDLIDSNSHSQ